MKSVKELSVVIDFCAETKLYVGYIPGFKGAHSQGETLEELRENLKEVVDMLLLICSC